LRIAPQRVAETAAAGQFQRQDVVGPQHELLLGREHRLPVQGDAAGRGVMAPERSPGRVLDPLALQGDGARPGRQAAQGDAHAVAAAPFTCAARVGDLLPVQDAHRARRFHMLGRNGGDVGREVQGCRSVHSLPRALSAGEEHEVRERPAVFQLPVEHQHP